MQWYHITDRASQFSIKLTWSASWLELRLINWLNFLVELITWSIYASLDLVQDNPGEPVPEETFTHSHPSWSSNISIYFLHLPRSVASSLFNSCTLQSFSIISQVFVGLPLGLASSSSYSIHFFNQSLSSFCSTYPYHCSLFCCSTEINSINFRVYGIGENFV